MSRKAPSISLNELKEKLKYLLEEENINGDVFPYNFSTLLTKDISKVNFDFENFTFGKDTPNFCNYPCGWYVLPSGIPVLFVNAGGDWEFPICFCLYFDGKNVRGYIPTDGNSFDKKNKIAWGNTDEPYDEEIVIKLVNYNDIINDVNTRIQIK
jgi:hypothetical protein